MTISNQEVAIDIAGGEGEYFFQKAQANPDQMFLVLDPRIKPIENKPDNLQLVQWEGNKDFEIPLKTNSVDEANINFLFGQIRNSDNRYLDEELAERDYEKRLKKARQVQKEAFSKLLRQLKRILSQDGKLIIVDHRENIDSIQEALEKEGYRITSQPSELEDENRTKTSKLLFGFLQVSNIDKINSSVLPMQIRARPE